MITLILGPMFSGKTSELIRLGTRSKIAGKKVVLLRPKTDIRPHLTHSRLNHSLDEFFVDRVTDKDLTNYDVICIDEGQFFKGSFVYDVNMFACKGKIIIVSGLNGTSELKSFENIQGLIPLAEEIIKLNAICTECGSEYGTFSYYKAGNKTEDIKVGDSHDYTALCRKCYMIKGDD